MNIGVKNTNSVGTKNGHHPTAFSNRPNLTDGITDSIPEILFMTSFPPRQCGIATYSQDLIRSLNTKFNNSFSCTVCALESDQERFQYTESVSYVINVDVPENWITLAQEINGNDSISSLVIQHEFGFFSHVESDFIRFMQNVKKPIIVVFHTVLPNPDSIRTESIRKIAAASTSVIVMTYTSAEILVSEYLIPKRKISVIPHGTHLVLHEDKEKLKLKYNLSGRLILSTFGLLSSGKSIETTLRALPKIIKQCPKALFLIIGKTHPTVVKNDGEVYREMLQSLITELHLEDHVQFINQFLPLNELLEYLQLTDVYLFTSKDPNQAVSGTFAYAISCGCPIVSTPIPHVKEVMPSDNGLIFEFGNSEQLANASIRLLNDQYLRESIGMDGIHRIASTAWENSATMHALLFARVIKSNFRLKYNIPEINLAHLAKMTTEFGLIQFSTLNQPDLKSGYTLDDNARALIAICMHFQLTSSREDLVFIRKYLDVIKYCLQPEGDFLNYINEDYFFTEQNNEGNLEDSNGRAIWALGYLISIKKILPDNIVFEASETMDKALMTISRIHSTRAMAFVIKGIYFRSIDDIKYSDVEKIQEFADRLVQMYLHESDNKWQWFESYLTYGNAVLPEALLCAWLATGDEVYRDIAIATFEFLLQRTFTNGEIKIISNMTWLHRKNKQNAMQNGGEQPIEVAYTIMALQLFYNEFKMVSYRNKIESAFEWFLGKNHLQQIIYNPRTGGCFDGLEKTYVNLNQGAESTLSYLISRLTLEMIKNKSNVSEMKEHYKRRFREEQIIHTTL